MVIFVVYREWECSRETLAAYNNWADAKQYGRKASDESQKYVSWPETVIEKLRLNTEGVEQALWFNRTSGEWEETSA